jgi:predicted RNA-binding Zn ribbon-like protein
MVNSELVIDFVNTARFDPEREDLTTPAALVAWLAEHGLQPGSRATKAEYKEALGVREALRDLLLAHNEVEADVGAASVVLDRAARRAGLAVRFAEGGAGIEPQASGVPGAVGRILAEVSAGMADGTWERVKACRAHDCRYAFLDTAKNRSRAWCSMQSCGNRAKVAAYRERHSA